MLDYTGALFNEVEATAGGKGPHVAILDTQGPDGSAPTDGQGHVRGLGTSRAAHRHLDLPGNSSLGQRHYKNTQRVQHNKQCLHTATRTRKREHNSLVSK